jgi:DivIVA domain-containing protein
MTWFFAFLIVAVMGAVAVVASGRGGSMAETFDDRPDSRVQADGPLTAADLRTVRFTTAFRGYRMSEVDALLDRLAAEMTPVPEAAPAEPPADEEDGGEPVTAAPEAKHRAAGRDGRTADGGTADGRPADEPADGRR